MFLSFRFSCAVIPERGDRPGTTGALSGEGSRGGSSPRVRAVRFVVAGFRRLGRVSWVCRAGRWKVVRVREIWEG